MSAYSMRAQPYLDALAAAVFSSDAARDWLVAGTCWDAAYRGAQSLHAEQAARRKPMRQPFYCNYWCGLDSRCACRIEGAKGLETDMMVFLQAPTGRRLGISIEMKAPGDRLRPGQAACYRLRAACWCQGTTGYSAIVPHDDWMTAIICPDADLGGTDIAHFDRAIGHGEAVQRVAGWPV